MLLQSLNMFEPVDFIRIFPKNSEYSKTDIREAAELARDMLKMNPLKRISAKQALKYSFFQSTE
jgi:hypothetical protein